MSETSKAMVFFLMWLVVTFGRTLAFKPYELGWGLGNLVSAGCAAAIGIYLYRHYQFARKENGEHRPRRHS